MGAVGSGGMLSVLVFGGRAAEETAADDTIEETGTGNDAETGKAELAAIGALTDTTEVEAMGALLLAAGAAEP